MSREIVMMLADAYPKTLKPLLMEESAEAMFTDFVRYKDEPDAMIALIVFEASWAGFSRIMAEEGMKEVMGMISADFQQEWA